MHLTFNRWRADDYSFYEETTIPFAMNDCNGHIKPQELSRLFMELAGDDFGERNLSHRYMMERGYHFILTRSWLHICCDVEDTARVTLRTWPYKAKSLQVFRAYEMRGQDGRLIACGSGIFMIIGPEGKPIRMRDFPFVDWERTLCADPVEYEPKGRIRAKGPVVDLGVAHAVFNDLDRNGHVNNSRYLGYAQDCLPQEYQNRPLCDVVVGYDAETKVGEDLFLRTDAAAIQDGVLQPDSEGWVRLYGQTAEGAASFGCQFRFLDQPSAAGDAASGVASDAEGAAPAVAARASLAQ